MEKKKKKVGNHGKEIKERRKMMLRDKEEHKIEKEEDETVHVELHRRRNVEKTTMAKMSLLTIVGEGDDGTIT